MHWFNTLNRSLYVINLFMLMHIMEPNLCTQMYFETLSCDKIMCMPCFAIILKLFKKYLNVVDMLVVKLGYFWLLVFHVAYFPIPLNDFAYVTFITTQIVNLSEGLSWHVFFAIYVLNNFCVVFNVRQTVIESRKLFRIITILLCFALFSEVE